MAGTVRTLLIAALLALLPGLAHGQGPALLPEAPVAVPSDWPPVPGLSPVISAPGTAEYFQPHVWPMPQPLAADRDPLLETDVWTAPGWFLGAEAELDAVHLTNRVTDSLQITPVRTDQLRVAGPDLGLSEATRVWVGYRMPNGIGEWVLSYRFLWTSGNGQVTTEDGFMPERARLYENVWDIDYANRQISLGPCWDMRWLVGIRLANVFFDARDHIALTGDSLGARAVDEHISNNFFGAGPRVGLELARKCWWPDLWFDGQVEGSALWGHVGQGFDETFTFRGASPLYVRADDSITQGVGTVMAQLGLRWTPCTHPHCRWFVGYRFEYWGQVGRNENTGSRADFYEHGLLLRGEYAF